MADRMQHFLLNQRSLSRSFLRFERLRRQSANLHIHLPKTRKKVFNIANRFLQLLISKRVNGLALKTCAPSVRGMGLRPSFITMLSESALPVISRAQHRLR